LYLDGNTYSQISHKLNERGFKTKLGNSFVSASILIYSRQAVKDYNGKRHKYDYKDGIPGSETMQRQMDNIVSVISKTASDVSLQN